MKWPQFELWRLFAAMALFALAFGALRWSPAASLIAAPLVGALIAFWLFVAAVGLLRLWPSF